MFSTDLNSQSTEVRCYSCIYFCLEFYRVFSQCDDSWVPTTHNVMIRV